MYLVINGEKMGLALYKSLLNEITGSRVFETVAFCLNIDDLFGCLFVALHPSKQLWSCRDCQFT